MTVNILERNKAGCGCTPVIITLQRLIHENWSQDRPGLCI